MVQSPFYSPVNNAKPEKPRERTRPSRNLVELILCEIRSGDLYKLYSEEPTSPNIDFAVIAISSFDWFDPLAVPSLHCILPIFDDSPVRFSDLSDMKLS